MSSLETGSINDNDSTIHKNDENEDENAQKSKIAYTNNVSSLDNYLLKQNQDEVLSTIGQQYSVVDLSHASKDPMIAGPRELFNKNVNLISH